MSPAPSSPSQSSPSSSCCLASCFILHTLQVFLVSMFDNESSIQLDLPPFTLMTTIANTAVGQYWTDEEVFPLKDIVKHVVLCRTDNSNSQNGISSCLLSVQAQLIHDRNTASHLTSEKAAGATADRVHMTWTRDKLIHEKNKQREILGVKDVFNMKP